MRVSENKVLRKIFVPKIEAAAKEWKEVHIKVLQNLCTSLNIVEINMRNRRMLYRITLI
jgi:hypothetical protein